MTELKAMSDLKSQRVSLINTNNYLHMGTNSKLSESEMTLSS